uniref:pyruvate kinase n=1 Tax=Cajanus cajan TaxID=3821 RepID=A0A151RHR7_CAJCA|nr:hypothetical protein KK1_036596 [Cajanus cajan]
MAQVTASRSFQTTPLCPPFGSTRDTTLILLKPPSFASKVFPFEGSTTKRFKLPLRSFQISARNSASSEVVPVSPEDDPKIEEHLQHLRGVESFGENSGGMWSKPTFRRKTKIVCTIGPSTDTKEMIWKLAEAGMNVARLNMSHGDHASHQKGPEVRSGDLPQPINLVPGQEFTFTIQRGVGTADSVSVNYDDFVSDVEVGDMLLVDGGMMSMIVKSKTEDSVKCEVVDGGELKSRRHLNVRGKSATLPSITEKDWDDIKFGVDNGVDFYAVSFVKDAEVVHELKNYLKTFPTNINLTVEFTKFTFNIKLYVIFSSQSSKTSLFGILGLLMSCLVFCMLRELLPSITKVHFLVCMLPTKLGVYKVESKIDLALILFGMIFFPFHERVVDHAAIDAFYAWDAHSKSPVPIILADILITINFCNQKSGKQMICCNSLLYVWAYTHFFAKNHMEKLPNPLRKRLDAIMLSGETAHGKFPLKAVKVMHTVALRTEATIPGGQMPPNIGQVFKNHMSEMFAYHATMMSNTLGTSTVVFTRTGFMASLLSHFRPSGSIFAFTDEKRVRQKLALYQGVCPIYMEFCDDSEATFSRALDLLQKQGMVKEGEEVALVQSGRQPIWRFQSTHNIQVRKV